jgi:hypothetical protein
MPSMKFNLCRLGKTCRRRNGPYIPPLLRPCQLLEIRAGPGVWAAIRLAEVQNYPEKVIVAPSIFDTDIEGSESFQIGPPDVNINP